MQHYSKFKMILSLDKVITMYLFLIQVPQKRLKIPSGWIAETIFPCTLKALTHCVIEAYNDFVGCGYAIQYPLWEKHNDGLGTVFLSTRHPLLDVNQKHLLPRS
ncbi:hypothetical protein V3564_02700 [Bartonella sp. B12(2025)]